MREVDSDNSANNSLREFNQVMLIRRRADNMTEGDAC
jgi:hypothetical protein